VFCAGTIYFESRYNLAIGRTTDDGGTWSQDTIFTASNGWAIAYDPTDSLRVYVAGDSMYSHPALYITTDQGESWTSSRTGLAGKLWDIAVAPDGQTLYAGSNNGVFKSTDRGASWAATTLTIQTRAVVIDPDSPNTVYAGTYGSGVHVTTNGGASWAAMNEGLSCNRVLTLALREGGAALLAGTDGGSVFRAELITAVAEPGRPASRGLAIRANPSLARGAVRLELALDAPGRVRLALFDHAGRGVMDLGERTLAAGGNQWRFETRGLAAGTYVVLARDGKRTACARLTVVE